MKPRLKKVDLRRTVRFTADELRQLRGNLDSARRMCNRKGVAWSDVIDALIGHKTALIVKTYEAKRVEKEKS